MGTQKNVVFGEPRHKGFLWKIFINQIAASPLVSLKLRHFIYKLFKLDTDSEHILSGCCFENNNVSIGKNCFINRGCSFDRWAFIEIGNDCAIANEVMFCTSTHLPGKHSRAGAAVGRPIKVGKGCWIGARVTILPGVVIGDGCIIAAGAVVNKDCFPNGLYAGVPARRIKDLEQKEKCYG